MNDKQNNDTWFITDEEQPPEGVYVLGHLEEPQGQHDTDPEGTSYVVVKIVRGISEAERAALPDNDSRKGIIDDGDEWGNNLKPYKFKTFGPCSYFGQEIDRWQYINRVKL